MAQTLESRHLNIQDRLTRETLEHVWEILDEGLGVRGEEEDRFVKLKELDTIEKDILEIKKRLAKPPIAAREITTTTTTDGTSSEYLVDYLWTMHVPSVYPTIQAALNHLSKYRIADGYTVTIQVADGTYNYTAPIYITHPQSDKIYIYGNTTTYTNCRLNFSQSGVRCHGFVCQDNHMLNINGFDIYCTGTTNPSDYHAFGLFAYYGGVIRVGSDSIPAKMRVSGFLMGICASKGGVIQADQIICNANHYNLGSFHNGHVNAEESGTAFTNATTLIVGLQPCGLYVAYNGNAFVDNASITGNGAYGILANSASTVSANNCIITGNGTYGVFCVANSTVIVDSGTVTGHSSYNFYLRSGGTVSAVGTTTVVGTANVDFDEVSFDGCILYTGSTTKRIRRDYGRMGTLRVGSTSADASATLHATGTTILGTQYFAATGLSNNAMTIWFDNATQYLGLYVKNSSGTIRSFVFRGAGYYDHA